MCTYFYLCTLHARMPNDEKEWQIISLLSVLNYTLNDRQWSVITEYRSMNK